MVDLRPCHMMMKEDDNDDEDDGGDDDEDDDKDEDDGDEDDKHTVALPGCSSTSWESRREKRRWTSSPTWV